ncbi:MAG: ROK family glucokinase [Peptococcaceae bacterium]|nr:ROK family glucokinase [Peptococcaceae bacterium]
MQHPAILGLDIGGTLLKMGLVNQQGDLLCWDEKPYLAGNNYQALLHLGATMAEDLLRKARCSWQDIAGVGVGIAAFLDLPRGIVVEAVNLGWHDVPLRQDLEKLWSKPVYVDNDANVAALGEKWAGVGKGSDNLLCLTLGTGVGGGVVIGGNIYHGANGSAGEIGHLTVKRRRGHPCNCGKRGCLETEVSARAIVRETLARIKLIQSEQLQQEYQATGTLSGQSVIKQAIEGEPVCCKVIAQAGRVLGRALAEISYVLNPELIIIGGGLSIAGEILYSPLRAAYAANVLPCVGQATAIVAAQLGNKAGMIGAAKLTQGAAHQFKA